MKRYLLPLLCLTAVCLPGTTKAAPILITELNLGEFPEYGDAHVQSEINKAIVAYNLKPIADLPTSGIGATPDFKLNVPENPEKLALTITGGSYNYIFLHWGGENADATYKNPELYYIGSLVGDWTFDAPFHVHGQDPQKQHGLSFYSLYSPKENVPDGGSTLVLLGASILGFVGLRSNFSSEERAA